MLNPGRDLSVPLPLNVRIEIAILTDAERRTTRSDLVRLRDIVVIGRQRDTRRTGVARRIDRAVEPVSVSLPAPGE